MMAWLALPLLIALILVAAKTHGRQIRLERELAGVWKVDFRADNGPVVAAIWRRDRYTFWMAFVPALALSGWFTVLGALDPWQLFGGLALSAGLAFALGFIVAGLASSFRLMGAMRRGSAPNEEWRRAGHRGSLLWWSLVAVLLAGFVAAVLV